MYSAFNPMLPSYGWLSKSVDDATSDMSTSTDSGVHSATSLDKEEFQLLTEDATQPGDSKHHELRTAPIVTRSALLASSRSTFPQRGLLGTVLQVAEDDGAPRTSTEDRCADNRLYINTNAPFSAVVCGVQGSGKSHTVSVLLENMLLSDFSQVGTLTQPLSGLVLHFGEGGADAQPSEAAWVSSLLDETRAAPRVVVYVSPSSLKRMRAVYGKVGSHVEVEPLLFSKSELDAQAFLSLMAIGSSENAPLYMQTILSILRELGEDYTYDEFIRRLELKKQNLNPNQLTGLSQRMELLESFLEKTPKKKYSYGTTSLVDKPPARFAAGQLTIIDLSDPFIDPASACGFFEILTRLFVRAPMNTGKVLVVDEAHKYLSSNRGLSGLTKELLSLVRQLRHQGMRVIISTQEPNVIPAVLIDLCGVTILHRFSSPSWLEHVAKHVSADMTNKDALDRIVRLQTGQAILLAPSGLGTFSSVPGRMPSVSQFGRRWALVKTRRRVTKDGGASILVVES